MINIILIDKEKNTIEIDLCDEKYKQLFKEKIDYNNIKRHKTKADLDKEVSSFLKKVNKNE